MNNSKKKFIAQYLMDHPESASSSLVKFDSAAISILVAEFEAELLVGLINRLPAQIISEGLLNSDKQLVANILSKIEVTLAARILRRWNNKNNSDKALSVIELLDPKVAKKVHSLMNYSEDVIAAVMNPTPFTVSPDLSLDTVLEMLKKQKNRYSRYIYVVDSEKNLIGVLPFKEVFYSEVNQQVSEIMCSSIFSFNVNTGIDVALKDNSWNKWDSLPVVDSKNKLQGVLKYDDLSKHSLGLQEKIKSNEDIVKAGHAVGEILQIGLNATITALSPNKGDHK